MIIPFGYINKESIIKSGLILNWDVQDYTSYSGTGTSITDLQGNSNGTFTGTITYTAGNPNIGNPNYLTIEGSNTEYVVSATGLNSKLSPVNSGTSISTFVWVYPTGNGIILDELGTTAINTSWHDSQIELVSGALKFRVWNLKKYRKWKI